jgi:hypothetical protein
MLTWIKVSINILLMVSATALARLELQTARVKDWHTFIIYDIYLDILFNFAPWI